MARRSLFSREVILKAKIGYSNSDSLKLGEYVGQRPFHEFDRDVRHLIVAELPRELEELFGIRARTRFIRFQSGSIEILFGVTLGLFGFVSGYGDFFDGIATIRNHAEWLLERLLDDKYQGSFNVSTEITYPRLRDPYDYRFEFSKYFDRYASRLVTDDRYYGYKQRDAFFWFLLVTTIVFATIIGLLVWAAVKKVYFT